MVVRSLVGFFVYKFPYSDHLPNFVDRILLENDSVRDSISDEYPTNSTQEPTRRNAKKEIHDRIMLNRRNVHLKYKSDVDTFKSGSMSGQGFDKDTLVDSTWDESEETWSRDLRMKQYLLEQNNKFNELINANLETFLKQQEKFGEKDANNSYVVELLRHGPISYLNYLNFLSNILGQLNSKNTKTQNELKIVENIVDESLRYNNSDSDEISNNNHSVNSNNFNLIPINDKISVNLNNAAEMEQFVSSLTDNDKLILWTKLNEDLNKESNKNEEGINSSESFNNIQTLTLILVKLFFSSIRRVIPILYVFYLKYSKDELFLVNKKNINGLLSRLIEVLGSLEQLLNSDKDRSSDNTCDKELLNSTDSLNGIYNKISFAAATDLTKDILANEDSWSSTVLRCALTKYLDRDNSTNYYEDPKYSQYFTKSHPRSAQSTESISSENSQSVTFLHAAEQFADEMI